MSIPTFNPKLYVVLDPSALLESARLIEVASAILRGGARVIQLRDKTSETGQLVASARALRAICSEFDARLIINDRVDVALASRADGVHLGPRDMTIADARRIAPSLLIGGSAGTPEAARVLAEQGADYLGVGALFDARASKPDASAPRGVEVLASVRAVVGELPLVGIGGISLENAGDVIAAGADGVAVIRAVVAQPDPEAAARAMLRVVTSAGS